MRNKALLKGNGKIKIFPSTSINPFGQHPEVFKAYM